jgi:hypothetical protein
MKTFFSTACLATALLTLASCGSTKQSASAPTGVQEFDQATGTWKPATKIVAPPAHQESAPLPQVASTTPQKHGVFHKPLTWVGLAKDDPPLPPVPPAPAKKSDTPPPPRSPIDPKPGARSLWQTIGDGIMKPFHAVGL